MPMKRHNIRWCERHAWPPDSQSVGRYTILIESWLLHTHPDDEEHAVDAGPLQNARRNDGAVEPAAMCDHQEQVHHEVDNDEVVLHRTVRYVRAQGHDGHLFTISSV